jgi:flavin-dependent thymidylate synthase
MIFLKPSVEFESPATFALLQLVERAGRTCYKSEDAHDVQVVKLLNEKFADLPTDSGPDYMEDERRKDCHREVTSGFIRRLLKSGHHSVLEHANVSVRFICDRGCCYHPDTLVLTVAGWKRFSAIKEGEEVFTLNDDGQLIPIVPVHKIEYDFDGHLVEINSSQVSLSVTPNHNCWVFDYEKRSASTRTWKFLRADKLVNGRYKFQKSCTVHPTDINSRQSEITLEALTVPRGFWTEVLPAQSFHSGLFWELLGLWATDGSISFGVNGSGNRISITQSKKDVCKRIEEILSGLNINYSKYKNEYRIKSPQLFAFVYNKFIKDFDQTSTRKSYYLRVPRELAQSAVCDIKAFLTGVVLGDGCTCADGRILITTVSEGFAQDLVELYLKIGKAANYYTTGKIGRTHPGIRPGQVFESKVQAYTVSVIREVHPLVHTKKSLKTVPYKGKVVCLELPKYHRLYVMQNGKAIWCGNSHELVRHRIAAFSQESTRYVNYGKRGGCQFIIPPWCNINAGEYVPDLSVADQTVANISLLTETEKTWFHAMIDAEWTYLKLLEQGWTPQQARSVLPNSTKTEIVVTMNLREWRHVLKLRTGKAAHPQMREVMLILLKKFKESEIAVVFEDITGDE